MTYTDFLATKRIVAPSVGIHIEPDELHPSLFPFQRDVVSWALRKGRAAIFLDTGLGKTFCQLEWADHAARATNGRALIVAPLAVAEQTVKEGLRFGIPVKYCRSQEEADRECLQGIVITNYEMLHRFHKDKFGAVVLDESSILKAFSGTTKRELCESFRDTPMKLCCSATPAPNDVVELTNHADFLGAMSPADMLSTFFISKGQDQKASRFRLKNHARKAFFRFLASWGMAVKKPSDIGHSDEGYNLPQLRIHPVRIESDYAPPDRLFLDRLKGVTDRANVRHGTIDQRVAAAVDLIRSEPNEQWLVWCGLNDESDALARALPNATEVRGSDTPEYKTKSLIGFSEGTVPILVSKARIAGFGMNFQSCARMVFVGIGDSYEQYYQCIRRCWRFGQTREVHAHIVYSTAEDDIYNNVLRKEAEAEGMSRELIANVREFEREELQQVSSADLFQPQEEARIPSWLVAA